MNSKQLDTVFFEDLLREGYQSQEAPELSAAFADIVMREIREEAEARDNFAWVDFSALAEQFAPFATAFASVFALYAHLVSLSPTTAVLDALIVFNL